MNNTPSSEPPPLHPDRHTAESAVPVSSAVEASTEPGPAVTKRVFITGGGGDLARAMISGFTRAGWGVDAPTHQQLDVTDRVAIDSWIARSPGCDLLVHNAGLRLDRPLARMSVEDWDRVMAVNLTAAHRLARAVTGLWLNRQKAGHVIFIGSHSGSRGVAGQANYAAAKAGLCGLAKSLARELGADGIRVNVVLPGFLDTRMTRDLGERERRDHLGRHALGRFNQVADAARFIVFLDGMQQVSGQVFQLDSRVDTWA